MEGVLGVGGEAAASALQPFGRGRRLRTAVGRDRRAEQPGPALPLCILPAPSPKQDGTLFLQRVQASPQSKVFFFSVLGKVSFYSSYGDL